MTQIFMASEWVRTDYGRFSPGRAFKRRLAVADALLYEEIALRREAPDLDERTDVLSLLLRARDEDGQAMTDAELRDELMTMLAAGHETTATGLSFAFELLNRNPATLERLREELEGDPGDGYLDAVVTEIAAAPARDRRRRADPEGAADDLRFRPSRQESRSIRASPWSTIARTSIPNRRPSGRSASSTAKPSPTRGFRSAAASAAASVPHSPRPRWRR